MKWSRPGDSNECPVALSCSDGLKLELILNSRAKWSKPVVTITVLGIMILFSTACKKEKQMQNTAQQEQMIADLRNAYAAFNRGDIDGAVKPLDEHIEWTEPESFPGGGTYHGREGAHKYLAESRAGLAEGASEPEKFIIAGDRIVVFVHAHVRPRSSNEWVDIRLADVYTVRDGKAIDMHAFADRKEALRWAGAADGNRS
jgi:ketosteroid isomerase-like protein